MFGLNLCKVFVGNSLRPMILAVATLYEHVIQIVKHAYSATHGERKCDAETIKG